MAEQTNTVHFSLGSDFGALMGNIAQEHLIYGLDPDKALRTFTDTFIGMENNLALKLLSGQDYVIVPECVYKRRETIKAFLNVFEI